MSLLPVYFYFNLYGLPSIVRVIKVARLRWAWHLACMGEINAYTS